MGIGLFGGSREDSTPCCTCPRARERIVERVVERRVEVPAKLPNPNPKNFRIVKATGRHGWVILLVHYPDCTNFEGNKVLVYANTTIADVSGLRELDPHFSASPYKCSPVARFEPTDKGWQMAMRLTSVPCAEGGY